MTALIAPGETGPYGTWKSRFVWRFMRGFKWRHGYYHKLIFGERDGQVNLLITTPDGEIVAQCVVSNPELLRNLIEHVNNANARAKLVRGE
jgi:hypothetical protein